MDEEPKSPSRYVPLLIWSTLVLLLVALAGCILWVCLPRWAPAFTIRHAPFPSLIFRAMTHAGEWGEESDTAVERLEEMGSAAGDTLVDGLQHPEPWVRVRVVRLLAKIADPRAFDVIARLRDDPHTMVRVVAIRTLPGIPPDPRAIDLIVAYLADPDPEVREAAVIALSDLQDERAHALLIDCLGKPPLAEMACRMLKGRKPSVTLDKILPLFAAGTEHALYLLSTSDDPRTAEMLAAEITGPGKPAPDPWYAPDWWQTHAASALILNPLPRCQEFARKLLRDPAARIRVIMTIAPTRHYEQLRAPIQQVVIAALDDPEPTVVAAAIGTCCFKIIHEADSRILTLMDHANPLIRETAAAYGGHLHPDPAAFRKLQALLSDPIEVVRIAAINGLGTFIGKSPTGSEPLQALFPALQDPVATVRLKALYELGGFPTSAATDALITQLADPEPKIRLALIDLLAQRKLSAAQTKLVNAAKDFRAKP